FAERDRTTTGILAPRPNGLGCVKTSTLAAGVEASRRNCIARRDASWRIVFSTFRGCMSFYAARVSGGPRIVSEWSGPTVPADARPVIWPQCAGTSEKLGRLAESGQARRG